tara:strand:- start:1682 stop:2203 length:522 start_codon:yes stop_codon:yes gene_type:complete
MKLYQLEIKRTNGSVKGHIVAPTEERAAELVFELFKPDNPEGNDFALERVDEILPADRRVGLDDLLEHASVGIASYSQPIGWVGHVAPVPELRLFRIDDTKGGQTFIIAPNADVASAIYISTAPLGKGEYKLFRIFDGLTDLPAERVMNLKSLLEFGPVGIATFHEQNGWSVH